ncbi:hypothetical protein WMY93_008648 [Mugilogobius chulae]|uniref:ribonuclease H n=1 Tax=Mugilogobius chulae TaxID=88201 RepID=A0AAW0PQJ8_9GOBI
MEPWQIINSQGNGPYAVRTLLGWVVNGPLNSAAVDRQGRPVASVNRISIESLETILRQQYSHDFPEKEYEERPQMSVEDTKFMNMMSQEATLKDNHYYLPLPLRSKDIVMPNNYHLAEQRAQYLAKKFKHNNSFAEEYKSFMEDIIAKDYAEKVPSKDLHIKNGKVWYIPHHGVYHRRKKTLRVVFDCTSSFQGTSLNKELLQGPDLTNSLLGVLLRFRQEQVAVMADIEGMFHQVRVNEEDSNLLRFLWWPNGDVSQPLQQYRMKVHLFGAVSSPSCANFALKKTADDNKHSYSATAVETIKSNFYVDDCLKSVPTEKSAIHLVKELTQLCAEGGFKLTKWISNSRSVLSTVSEENKAKQIKELDLDRDKLPVERALVKRWKVWYAAEKVIGCSLPSLQDLYVSRTRGRAGRIAADPSHPGHGLFEPLPSGRRLRSIRTRTSRHKNSFFPSAVGLMNTL